MRFEFWLEDMLLPVTPGSYELDYGTEIETLRATAKGDVNMAGHKQPRTVSLTGFFTVKDYPFANDGGFRASTPMDYVEQVQQWVDKKEVIRLVIADEDSTKINAQFYVESIRYSESSQTGGDMDYTITLREFSGLKTTTTVSRVSTSSAYVSNQRPEGKPPPKPKTYTVQNGDYLVRIARQFYGDGNQWQKIYNANKAVIGKNPNIIYTGQVLSIP